MKIVDVSEFYSERGGGIRSHLTVRGHFLCQLGHDHVVVAPGPRDEDARPIARVAPSFGQSRIVRIAGPAMPYDPTYHLLARFDRVRRCVDAEHPDILEAHSPYLGAGAVVSCGRRAAPVRTAFWHADHVGTFILPAVTRYFGDAAARVVATPLWRGVRALLAPFDATFVAGRAQAERLKAAGVPRVVHVPFGVDTRTFHPAARSEELRREWLAGEPEGAVVLVGAGRFAMEKRWDIVLEAFGRLRSQRRAILVLFGDGPERSRLERTAPPGVRFPGFERDRDKLALALASADVLVHGCPYETFGLGVAEAIACGLPVIVPDAGGAAESVDLSCGAVYRSLDAAACADAIERLLRVDPYSLRTRAIDAAARAPTMAQHFGKVVSAYEELLAEKESGRPRLARG